MSCISIGFFTAISVMLQKFIEIAKGSACMMPR